MYAFLDGDERYGRGYCIGFCHLAETKARTYLMVKSGLPLIRPPLGNRKSGLIKRVTSHEDILNTLNTHFVL